MGGAVKAVTKVVKSSPLGSAVSKYNPIVNNAMGMVGRINGQPTGGIKGSSGSGNLSDMERRAGVSTPEYAGLTDETGALKSQYSYDPTKSAAFTKMREQAMAAPGESPWAKMQLEKQGLEQAGQFDNAARSTANAVAQQQSNLARFGGLSGGARERMATTGMRDLARSNQDVARQGMMSRLGIQESDIGRQQDMLGRVGTTELEAQGKNIAALTGDVQGRGAFDMERYRQQMAAYGAEQTARGQERAASMASQKPGGLMGAAGKVLGK